MTFNLFYHELEQIKIPAGCLAFSDYFLLLCPYSVFIILKTLDD